MSALVALLDMPAPRRSAAGGDVIEHSMFRSRDPAFPVGDQPISVRADNIGEFQSTPTHRLSENQFGGSVASSGLWTAAISRVETWV